MDREQKCCYWGWNPKDLENLVLVNHDETK